MMINNVLVVENKNAGATCPRSTSIWSASWTVSGRS